MGVTKSGWDVEHNITGRWRAGAVRPDPPQRQLRRAEPAQEMGDALELPIAQSSGPSTMWFNNTGEFDRWYRRLHPMRHVVARRLQRIEREQQREREIEMMRERSNARDIELTNLGQSDRLNAAQRASGDMDRLLEYREQRNERQRDILTDQDPQYQFNRRARRRFEEAMQREADALADELQRMRIAAEEVD